MQGPHITYTEWGKKYGKVYKVSAAAYTYQSFISLSWLSVLQTISGIIVLRLRQQSCACSTFLELSQWW